MASRMQVASYVAEQLPGKRASALKEAAAWLVDTGRTRQADYLARDVALALAERGYVLVHVTTARPLTAAARTQIEGFVKAQTGAKELELTEAVDPAVVGGARIELPGKELDGTVRARLDAFVQGVKL